MALSLSFAAASSPPFNLSCCNPEWKLLFVRSRRRKYRCLCVNSLRISDNGAIEPAGRHLERLFVQTQKLEERIRRDPRSPAAVELIVNLDELESGLHAAFSALKQKEEDLQDAEKRMRLEYDEISRVRRDLERREAEMVSSAREQKKLEEELRQANEDLASQMAEISDLKLELSKRGEEISASQLALLDKQEEIARLKLELGRKDEEAINFEAELSSRAKLLDEANMIVKKQEAELQELKAILQMKEEELDCSIRLQKCESEKLDAAEESLRKQTANWLMAQGELKKLVDESSKNIGEARSTSEEFQRARELLADMRSELVLAQKELASSRKKVEEQTQLLEKQLKELTEQKSSVMAYMMNLRDALLEVESERVKLNAAEAENRVLEDNLRIEKELVRSLQKELDEERMSLKRATKRSFDLQVEIEKKSAAFEQKQMLLKSKETEFMEAKLEIERLKSGQASLRLVLEEKDKELANANEIVGKLNKEIKELKEMLSKTESELIQAVSTLKVKNEHFQTMQHQITAAKTRSVEAETVVCKIIDLTRDVLLSVNDSGPSDDHTVHLQSPLQNSLTEDLRQQKMDMESELEFTKEALKSKEMEAMEANKDLTLKEDELNLVKQDLHAKEEEITRMKDEIVSDKHDLEHLHALYQERIGENSVGDIATEKLQLEAATLEAEAATTALYKITEMSRMLAIKAGSNMKNILYQENGPEFDGDQSKQITSEISRLLRLTEHLLVEAGINGSMKAET